jgi:hypothetical protein
MLGHPKQFLITARLHAFSDGQRWALLLESAGYNPRAANVVNLTHLIASHSVEAPDGLAVSYSNARVENSKSVFTEFRRSKTHFYLLLRGRSIPFLWPIGFSPEEALRNLEPEHQRLFLLDEGEIRLLVPTKLPEVLRLDAWHHLDMTAHPANVGNNPIANRRRALLNPPGQPETPLDVRPSNVDTYIMIAHVLATGNAKLYTPTRPANTHWSLWPNSGSL